MNLAPFCILNLGFKSFFTSGTTSHFLAVATQIKTVKTQIIQNDGLNLVVTYGAKSKFDEFNWQLINDNNDHIIIRL